MSTLYVGRRMRTMTSDGPARPTGVLVDGGRVTAVGDAQALRREHDPAVVDFGGGVITPGLVDGHSHPVHGLALTAGTNLTEATDLDAVRAALSTAREALEPGEWLRGWGLNPVVFDGREPSAAALGPALARVPAYVSMYDGHSAIASPDALRAAGIDGPREFRSSARIACDRDGVPTGYLLEEEASSVVEAVIPTPPVANLANGLYALLQDMAATGLTGLHAMDFADPSAEVVRELERTRELPLRLGFNPILMPTDETADRVLEWQGQHGRRWRVEGVKMFVDGTIDGGTAWLERADAYGEGTESLWTEFGRFRDLVTRLHLAGANVAVHSIGDRGVREVLELFTELRDKHGPLATHRIEHIETIPDDVVRMFGSGGAVASMHPLHLTRFNTDDRSDSWSRRLGDARVEHGFPWAAIRAAGGPVALGSDWPIAPYDPRWIMADARLRRRFDRPERTPMQPELALDAEQVLEGFTTHAALASGEAEHRGRIAPGYDADFTVFADDPVAVDAETLGTLPILATVVAGEVIHAR
ncbi:MAG: amidohydrolase [Nocardioidaceae bacterium]